MSVTYQIYILVISELPVTAMIFLDCILHMLWSNKLLYMTDTRLKRIIKYTFIIIEIQKVDAPLFLFERET